jgi:hypothetical protein
MASGFARVGVDGRDKRGHELWLSGRQQTNGQRYKSPKSIAPDQKACYTYFCSPDRTAARGPTERRVRTDLTRLAHNLELGEAIFYLDSV